MKHNRCHSSDDNAKLGSGKNITMAKELYGPPSVPAGNVFYYR